MSQKLSDECTQIYALKQNDLVGSNISCFSPNNKNISSLVKVRTPARLGISLLIPMITFNFRSAAVLPKPSLTYSSRRLAQPSVGDPPSFSANARGASGDGLLAGGAVPTSSQAQRYVGKMGYLVLS